MRQHSILQNGLTVSAALAILIATGCGHNETARSNGVDQLVSEVQIPTQEEADRRAAQEITQDNADEVFRRLEREILAEEDDL